MKIEGLRAGINDLRSNRQIADYLGEVAAERAATIPYIPRHLRVFTRHGVSRRGAYAQIILRGPGALTWEFGNRSRPPRAPLRRAVGGRG